jgi:hypothetical protein
MKTFKRRKKLGRRRMTRMMLATRVLRVFGQHLKSIHVNFNFKVNIHITDGHAIGKSDGGFARGYQLLDRYDLGLQHLYAIANQTQKVKDSLFIARLEPAYVRLFNRQLEIRKDQ